jgi:hypothetical protein
MNSKEKMEHPQRLLITFNLSCERYGRTEQESGKQECSMPEIAAMMYLLKQEPNSSDRETT